MVSLSSHYAAKIVTDFSPKPTGIRKKVNCSRKRSHEQICSYAPVIDYGEGDEVRRLMLSQRELSALNSPEGIVKLNEDGINQAVERRIMLFFLQSILCHEMPFHFENNAADLQIGSASALKFGKIILTRQAAHPSTTPCIVAYRKSEWDRCQQLKKRPPKMYVYLKGSYAYYQNNSTIGMHDSVNKADILVDNVLREPAMAIINSVAQGILDPMAATRDFLIEFQTAIQQQIEKLDKKDPHRIQRMTLHREQRRLTQLQRRLLEPLSDADKQKIDESDRLIKLLEAQMKKFDIGHPCHKVFQDRQKLVNDIKVRILEKLGNFTKHRAEELDKQIEKYDTRLRACPAQDPRRIVLQLYQRIVQEIQVEAKRDDFFDNLLLGRIRVEGNPDKVIKHRNAVIRLRSAIESKIAANVEGVRKKISEKEKNYLEFALLYQSNQMQKIVLEKLFCKSAIMLEDPPKKNRENAYIKQKEEEVEKLKREEPEKRRGLIEKSLRPVKRTVERLQSLTQTKEISVQIKTLNGVIENYTKALTPTLIREQARKISELLATIKEVERFRAAIKKLANKHSNEINRLLEDIMKDMKIIQDAEK